MAPSDRQLLDALSWVPFVDSMELAFILGEPHTTVHRTLTDLLAVGIVGCVSHGTVHQIRLEAVLDAIDMKTFGLMAAIGKIELDNFRERSTMGKRGTAKQATPQDSLPYLFESSSKILLDVTQQKGLGSEIGVLPWV